MGKFDKEIAEEANRLKEPYIAFQWETGFTVITQSAFSKLKGAAQAKLLAPMFQGKQKKKVQL